MAAILSRPQCVKHVWEDAAGWLVHNDTAEFKLYMHKHDVAFLMIFCYM